MSTASQKTETFSHSTSGLFGSRPTKTWTDSTGPINSEKDLNAVAKSLNNALRHNGLRFELHRFFDGAKYAVYVKQYGGSKL